MLSHKIKSLTKQLVDEIVDNVPPTLIDETLIEIQNEVMAKLDRKLGVPYSELCRAEMIHQMSLHEGRYHVTLS